MDTSTTRKLATILTIVFSASCVMAVTRSSMPITIQGAQDYTPVTDERLVNPEPENWLMYRRTYSGSGYSPLDQINRQNVENMVPLWCFSTGVTEGHQSPPIVNDGIMFITTPESQLLALDARKGDLLWRYRRELPEDLFQMHPTNRGVGLYENKVYMATVDTYLVAFDAKSGEVVWEKAVEDYHKGYYMTLAPLVVNGKVLVGVSGGEWGIRGFIQAFDAMTGEQVWKTHTIPAPNEPGGKTWPGDSWRTGGAPTWITGTFDPKLNLIYWGTGNPAPWIGDARPGDNLYANSVVALDADSGAIKAYHQYHWNGSWDWDEVSAPILMDVQRNGRTIKALVHAGRNGYLWLLERSADKIAFVDAKPYVRQNAFTRLDPKTGRPEYDLEHKPTIGKKVSFCPSHWGGKNWPPAAADPKTGYLYIPANENLCAFFEGEEATYHPGRVFTGVDLGEIHLTLRSDTTHIGELQAWDMNTGQRIWTQRFKSHNWGPVLTTAGGLVLMGGTNDRYFRVFDAKTGEILWKQRTNSGITAVPISYAVDGVQYIAVQSGWGIDAQQQQLALDRIQGNKTHVPQGGVLWVFALKN